MFLKRKLFGLFSWGSNKLGRSSSNNFKIYTELFLSKQYQNYQINSNVYKDFPELKGQKRDILKYLSALLSIDTGIMGQYYLNTNISRDSILIFGYNNCKYFWNNEIIPGLGFINHNFISVLQFGNLSISYYMDEDLYKLKSPNGKFIASCKELSTLLKYLLLLVQSSKGNTNINYSSPITKL